jgi:hypothetical protein
VGRSVPVIVWGTEGSLGARCSGALEGGASAIGGGGTLLSGSGSGSLFLSLLGVQESGIAMSLSLLRGQLLALGGSGDLGGDLGTGHGSEEVAAARFRRRGGGLGVTRSLVTRGRWINGGRAVGWRSRDGGGLGVAARRGEEGAWCIGRRGDAAHGEEAARRVGRRDDAARPREGTQERSRRRGLKGRARGGAAGRLRQRKWRGSIDP